VASTHVMTSTGMTSQLAKGASTLAGNQEDGIRRVVPAFKIAKAALERAKQAPHGPGTEKALKDAQADFNTHEAAFTDAYNKYANHMTAHHQTPQPAEHFLS